MSPASKHYILQSEIATLCVGGGILKKLMKKYFLRVLVQEIHRWYNYSRDAMKGGGKMVVAAYSNRIYKSEADTSFLDNMLIELNDAKISLYSKMAKVNTEDEKINTTFVTERYGLNSYYANMVIRAAKGVFSCNKELRETNIDVAEENIEKKTEQIEKHLETLKSIDSLSRAL